MKKILSLRFLITVIGLISFLILIKSCTKVDQKAIDSSGPQVNAKAIEEIKHQYGNVSAAMIQKVNKNADTIFYRNSSGRMVNLFSPHVGNSSMGGPCNSCSTTSDPAQLRIRYTLNYVQRFYLCEGTGNSNLTVNWTVSVPFSLNIVAGVGPEGNTYGVVDITDPSNTSTLHHSAAASDLKIINEGADPVCSYNTLYEISYSYNNISDTYFGNGTSITAALSLDNNCSLVNNVTTSGHVTAPTTSLTSYLACNRLDKLFINPHTGAAPGYNTTATGCYVICTHPSGSFEPIDNHQLEYRRVLNTSSDQWDDQTGIGNDIYNAAPVFTTSEIPEVSPYGTSDLVHMTSGSGYWLIRYRNVKSSCGSITPKGSVWSIPESWTVEKWSAQ